MCDKSNGSASLVGRLRLIAVAVSVLRRGNTAAALGRLPDPCSIVWIRQAMSVWVFHFPQFLRQGCIACRRYDKDVDKQKQVICKVYARLFPDRAIPKVCVSCMHES